MRTLILLLIASSLVAFKPIAEPKAKMKVFVVNEAGQVVADAMVTVYDSFEDYEKEVNPKMSGVTNAKGFIQFKKLEEKKYYLHVEKGDMNNHTNDNATEVLRVKGKNRFEILID